MKFSLNENVSGSVIRRLREAGHDVLAAKESMQGESDSEILIRAQTEGRIVVTHDKDFGELAFRFGLTSDCGVVLIRLAGNNPQSDSNHTFEVLQSREDWSGNFSVIEYGRVRMRKLTPSGQSKKPK